MQQNSIKSNDTALPMSRRQILLTTAALASASVAKGAFAQEEAGSIPSDAPDLAVRMMGQVFTPQEKMEDFNGYAYWRDRRTPWEVRFATNGDRKQIEFCYSEVTSSKDVRRAPAYTAEIMNAGEVVEAIDLPFQDFHTRWRWQSKSISPTQDIPLKRVLPFRKKLDGSSNVGTAGRYDGPFVSRYRIAADFGATGERPDIGLYTEWAAEYLLYGGAKKLEGILTQAEAHGQFANHIRSPEGSWIDYSLPQYMGRDPHLNHKGKAHWLASQPDHTLFYHLDVAHYPSICWVPWLVTGDTYYLEELQAAVVGHLGLDAYRRTWDGLGYFAQMRGVAWCLRDAFYAYVATPEVTPSWLLPKSFFARVIQDGLNYMNKRISHPDNVWAQRFGYWQIPGSRGMVFWQHEFLCAVLGMGVYMGLDADFSTLKPTWEYLLANTIARTSGDSGWAAQYSTPYNLNQNERPPLFGKNETTWTELWQAWASRHNIKLNPKANAYLGRDKYYLSYTRGALAIAVLNGREDVRPIHDKMRKWMGGSRSTKWAIGVG